MDKIRKETEAAKTEKDLRTRKKILITGFDPFGGEPINPAWEAVKRVQAPDDVILTVKRIPTVFTESVRVLLEEIRNFQPDAVLCVGQAAGRKGITPERVAVNVDDARIPDNAGNQPVNQTIEPDGENVCFSSLPVYKISEKLNEAGIPAAVSDSAGTFVCNHLMYGLLYFIQKEKSEMKGGFLHVPCVPEQLTRMPANTPSLPLEEIVRGLEIALAVIAEDLTNDPKDSQSTESQRKNG